MSVASVAPARFLAALAGARTIELAAYTLPPGAVRDGLAAAARRGAQVTVRLEGSPPHDPQGRLAAYNADLAKALRAAGVSVVLTSSSEPQVHLKAALTDGVAWLDDRNWGGHDATLLRDDTPADVRVVRRALAGEPARDARLATTKRDAQVLELAVLASAGRDRVEVATESFGYCAIASALMARARTGCPTRLLVCGREARAANGGRERGLLKRLVAAGVEVRIGGRHGAAEKLALGGAAGWVGSANATWAEGRYGAMSDWGLITRSRRLLGALHAAFARDWNAAQPLA